MRTIVRFLRTNRPKVRKNLRTEYKIVQNFVRFRKILYDFVQNFVRFRILYENFYVLLDNLYVKIVRTVPFLYVQTVQLYPKLIEKHAFCKQKNVKSCVIGVLRWLY